MTDPRPLSVTVTRHPEFTVFEWRVTDGNGLQASGIALSEERARAAAREVVDERRTG